MAEIAKIKASDVVRELTVPLTITGVRLLWLRCFVARPFLWLVSRIIGCDRVELQTADDLRARIAELEKELDHVVSDQG